jgi:HPt (histidine-containing phosphotransfer) domain-containing protein
MTIDENTSAAGQPAVDFEQLRAASGDDNDLLNDLVGLYFGQAADIMTSLRAALDKHSAADVDYLSHKLVGASLACGMTAMVAPLREMEMRGRKGDLTGVEEFMAQTVVNLETVRSAVDEYLRSGQTS